MFTIIGFVILILSIIVHEFAHGYVAHRLGDPTASDQGRLTLNPIPHLDLMGCLIVPGLLFLSGSPVFLGWAKPVPVNPNMFRNPVRDFAIVAFAGPLSNFAIALLASLLGVIARLIIEGPMFTPSQLLFFLILKLVIMINIFLGVFNLVPIPPLDGSRILALVVPRHLLHYLYDIEKSGFVLIFLLAYFGLFHTLFELITLPITQLLTSLFI